LNEEKTVTSDEFIQVRRSRLRKTLPALQLEYPNDAEMRDLSDLIGTADPTFSDAIKSIILDAHLNDYALRKVLASDVAQMLKSLRSRTTKLQESLSAIDVGARGSAHHAGLLLEFELGPNCKNGSLNLIRKYVQLLGDLIAATDGAIKRGQPKRGRGGNPAFDRFIESLDMQARQRNSKLTVFRVDDGRWSGSFLDAVRILKPYLPELFLPNSDLGRSIEHVRKKLNQHITKNATSHG
jgi:hypothetical protein